MITFEEARELVAATLPEDFVVAAWGRENDELYQVPAGPPEIFDDDVTTDELPTDVPLIFVDKESGEITRRSMIASFALLDSMTPIGEIPA